MLLFSQGIFVLPIKYSDKFHIRYIFCSFVGTCNFYFTQHLSGLTYTKGNTLDLVFTFIIYI